MITAKSLPACPERASAGTRASTPPKRVAIASLEPPVFCFNSSRNPPRPFAFNPAELNCMPNSAAKSVASLDGFAIVASIALKPVTATLVETPPLVSAAVEAVNSSKDIPICAASGATVPIDADSSPMVVLPAFIAINIASDTAVAPATLSP